MKRKFLTLIAAVAAAMALALSAGAEAATPETAGSLTPLMPMFDTADTGIAEYSGDIVQEDAATYDASYNANEDVAANERDVYNYLTAPWHEQRRRQRRDGQHVPRIPFLCGHYQ